MDVVKRKGFEFIYLGWKKKARDFTKIYAF